MEIHLNTHSAVRLENAAKQARVERNRVGEDGVNFATTAAIEGALAAEPDMRAELIARGEEVIGSPQYPPPEIIKRIARLIAAKGF